ncbi:MAG: phage portal protein [Planctomycetia bacterium]|nr:phage portal protein [Planctomycetia bacterium]
MIAQELHPELQDALRERQELFARSVREENRLLRESLDLLGNYVDPSEVFRDSGELWGPLGTAEGPARSGGFATEEELAAARNQCRALALSNEFAINGHENRISYIVGSGHQYRVTVRKAAGEVPETEVAQVQAVLDEFLEVNRWRQRQQEIVRRRDRDGEALLRFFLDAAGKTRVRFVEPWQLTTPRDLFSANGKPGGRPRVSMGVETEPDDVESVAAYWLDDGERVESADVQHRKANVDANVLRGVPLFYPVRHNLLRAEKLLRNMAAVADVQTAVALIRKHRTGTRSSIEQLRSGLAAATAPHPVTGQTTYLQQLQPGTILDVFGDTEYDFPAQGIDASRFVLVLQAILRAVASRLVMPEFMLTSDASNANYSSTLVAEGPAVKMFERLQHEMRQEDEEVMRRVLSDAVRTGRLDGAAVAWAQIETVMPGVAVRNRLQEAQIDRMLVTTGAMSATTMAQRHGLDAQTERRLRKEEGKTQDAADRR